MLARAYAGWIAGGDTNDQLRARVIFGLLVALAERRGRLLPPQLRLRELAGAASIWPLDVPAGEILSTWPESRANGGQLGESLLQQRLDEAQVFGEALDLLYGVETVGARSGDDSLRRRSGSYFTPRKVARSLVEESLQTPHLDAARQRGAVRVCDPAMGGGAFLLEAASGLAGLRVEQGEAPADALRAVGRTVFGCDRSELAVATAEAALFWLTELDDWRLRLRVADSLLSGERMLESGFDWLIGNPPWVAFQGRAAQRLAPERRAWLKRTYSAFAGYPTLHGVFAERAAQLAPHGFISLLLPSSLSDLDGYRAARRAFVRSHAPHEPLLEYGQDAFSGVVQPCFGLLASPRIESLEVESDRPWRLRERTRHGVATREQEPPATLVRLAALPKLPAACFGELGLQSNRRVTSELFLRADAPTAPFVVPLMEGRNVRAFRVDAPRLFMNPDPAVLAESKCRLRPLSDYERVGFVVRQTAAVTIAARLTGLRFRNSLLAGYATEEFDVELLLGLLNSTLFRAFHSSRQRDARQAAFPQVKVAHLRQLPAPPAISGARARVRAATVAMEQGGSRSEGQVALDAAVFELYGIPPAQQVEITSYLAERLPRPRSS